MEKKEKSEVEYRKDKYWELEREYQRRDELHRKVGQDMQVELSQTKDKLKENNEYLQSYKKLLKEELEKYKELYDKYIFVLKKLNNIPELQKQSAEMIKYYEYMTSHDRVVGPVLGLIAGVAISIILYSIF